MDATGRRTLRSNPDPSQQPDRATGSSQSARLRGASGAGEPELQPGPRVGPGHAADQRPQVQGTREDLAPCVVSARRLQACFARAQGADAQIQLELAKTSGGCDFDTSRPGARPGSPRIGGTIRNVFTVRQAVDGGFLAPDPGRDCVGAGLATLLEGRKQLTVLGRDRNGRERLTIIVNDSVNLSKPGAYLISHDGGRTFQPLDQDHQPQFQHADQLVLSPRLTYPTYSNASMPCQNVEWHHERQNAESFTARLQAMCATHTEGQNTFPPLIRMDRQGQWDFDRQVQEDAQHKPGMNPVTRFRSAITGLGLEALHDLSINVQQKFIGSPQLKADLLANIAELRQQTWTHEYTEGRSHSCPVHTLNAVFGGPVFSQAQVDRYLMAQRQISENSAYQNNFGGGARLDDGMTAEEMHEFCKDLAAQAHVTPPLRILPSTSPDQPPAHEHMRYTDVLGPADLGAIEQSATRLILHDARRGHFIAFVKTGAAWTMIDSKAERPIPCSPSQYAASRIGQGWNPMDSSVLVFPDTQADPAQALGQPAVAPAAFASVQGSEIRERDFRTVRPREPSSVERVEDAAPVAVSLHVGAGGAPSVAARRHEGDGGAALDAFRSLPDQ